MTYDTVPIAFIGGLFMYLLFLTAVGKISEWRNKRGGEDASS